MSCILSKILCDVDVQLSHQYFGGCPDGPGMFDSPFFAVFTSRLSSILIYMVSPCLSPDSGSSDALNLIDVADIFVRILFRRMLPMMHLRFTQMLLRFTLS